MQKRKIELYGRLRDSGLGHSPFFDLRDGITAGQALAAIKASFGSKAVFLNGCVLATESEILSAADRLPPGRLALLPPVCGG